jgi:hypothetical protein
MIDPLDAMADDVEDFDLQFANELRKARVEKQKRVKTELDSLQEAWMAQYKIRVDQMMKELTKEMGTQ